MKKIVLDELEITFNQDVEGTYFVTDDNYDGAPDADGIIGTGDTQIQALLDYFEKMGIYN